MHHNAHPRHFLRKYVIPHKDRYILGIRDKEKVRDCGDIRIVVLVGPGVYELDCVDIGWVEVDDHLRSDILYLILVDKWVGVFHLGDSENGKDPKMIMQQIYKRRSNGNVHLEQTMMS